MHVLDVQFHFDENSFVHTTAKYYNVQHYNNILIISHLTVFILTQFRKKTHMKFYCIFILMPRVIIFITIFSSILALKIKLLVSFLPELVGQQFFINITNLI